MTRAVPTDSEATVAQALVDWLLEAGRTVSNVVVADAPDVRLEIDGERWAFELIQIPPSDVYRWSRTRFDAMALSYYARTPHIVEVVWPKELHTWVRLAIEKKSRNAARYREAVQCPHLGLLLHGPTEKCPLYGFTAKDGEMLMGYGAGQAKHAFDSVLFWSQDVPVRVLHPLGGYWTVDFDYSRGYATEGFRFAVGSFTTTNEDEPRKRYDSGPLLPDVIMVEPLDPMLKQYQPRFERKRYRVIADVGSTDVRLQIVEDASEDA
jgi:hypothetical protein